MTQSLEYTPRKRPTQARAQATFDALVEACARLLSEHGYASVTTNAIAERAGVGIGSLYEYFPGKDAIVAVVAERMTERVMATLDGHMQAIVANRSPDEMLRWLRHIHATLEAERRLIAVFIGEVPFTYHLDVTRDMVPRLLQFSDKARRAAGIEMARPGESLLMVNNLVASTMLQIVLSPIEPEDADDMIQTLADRVNDLIASSTTPSLG